MKTERNILVAFILNISFSIFELIGGLFTNSVSIMSDAVHDLADAISIGISLILEKISKKKPNEEYTYGYIRYSVFGALITTTILTVGSILVIIGGVNRIINPRIINYDGMIIFAIFGVVINFMAAYFTKEGDSVNQKAVNLHMLEDVLGWVVVLIGSILMKFTDISIIDSIMSICIAIFILINAFKNLKKILDLFLEKTPKNISIKNLKNDLLKIKDVVDVHHVHVWSMDGISNYATMHVVARSDNQKMLKNKIKKDLKKIGIIHTTVEIECMEEKCNEKNCNVKVYNQEKHHHH